MNIEYDVIVIGGGPAGMMAAIVAAGRNKKVLLIEKNKILGKKLLITGKGRCNITNNVDIGDFINNIPVNGNFLYSSLYSFTNKDLIDFFEKRNLKVKVERGGRVFPISDKSSDVRGVLLKELKKNNVNILFDCVSDILFKNGKITGVLTKSEKYFTSNVIIATGGKSYPETGSTGDGYIFAQKCGHTIKKIYPSLVPLESKDNFIKELQGLSLRNIFIKVFNNNNLLYSEFGEIIFTHFGLSGPLILSASSHMRGENIKCKLFIDLKPALNEDVLDKRIQRDFLKYSKKMFSNSLNDLLPKKIIPVIVKLSQIDPSKTVNQITKEERRQLVFLLKNFEVNITGKRPIKEAIITSGGISVDEINPQTLESKIVKGLFFCGEVIDVDAYTGGYNLQIAFSTGYAAGYYC